MNCSILLIAVSILTIASSILLECLHGKSFLDIDFSTWIWLHIGMGIACSIVVFYHVYLHLKKPRHWLKWVFQLNSKLTKWLAWSFGIVAITGIIAMVCVCCGMGHTAIGGLHGKIGLFLIFLMIYHLIKRWTWFKGRIKGQTYYPSISNEKCIRCGLCVKRCPAQVFEKQGKQIVVSRTDYCLQCKKCVLHCPKGAIK